MKVIRFSDYIKEAANIKNNDGILVIVDLQRIYDKFTPQNFEENVIKYCKEFPKDDNTGKGVYQIWDANKAQNFSYNFPNTLQTIKKNYGTKFDNRIKKIAEDLLKKYPNAKEGQQFKLKDSNSFLVRVNNNHKWFYVNEDLYNLYLKLKGKTVVVVGGASEECLEDLYISMKSFGINPIYNHDYIYSAQTNDNQVASPK
jgi:predicted MPP superfamily phosphohydrolase